MKEIYYYAKIVIILMVVLFAIYGLKQLNKTNFSNLISNMNDKERIEKI